MFVINNRQFLLRTSFPASNLERKWNQEYVIFLVLNYSYLHYAFLAPFISLIIYEFESHMSFESFSNSYVLCCFVNKQICGCNHRGSDIYKHLFGCSILDLNCCYLLKQGLDSNNVHPIFLYPL